jgi:hypothetical protein
VWRVLQRTGHLIEIQCSLVREPPARYAPSSSRLAADIMHENDSQTSPTWALRTMTDCCHTSKYSCWFETRDIYLGFAHHRTFSFLVDAGLVCRHVMWTCMYISTFRSGILPPSSRVKMEAVCSPETLVPTDKCTRCNSPEDQHRHLHRRQILKSHMLVSLLI